MHRRKLFVFVLGLVLLGGSALAYTPQLAFQNIDVAGATVARFSNASGTTTLHLGTSSIGGGSGFGANNTWSMSSGVIQVANGTEAAPSISFASDADTGLYRYAGDSLAVTLGGTARVRFVSTGVQLRSTVGLEWSSGAVGAASDVILVRDAAGRLALRNGTNAQRFSAYETFTDGSNNERYSFIAENNMLSIIALTAGSGSDNLDIRLTPAGTGTVQVAGPLAISNVAEGSVGNVTIGTARATHTLAAAGTSTTTDLDIPDASLVFSCSLTVDEAVVDDGGDDTWSAELETGSSTSIAAGAAAAQNTKVDLMFVPEVVTDETEMLFTAQGGSFSAGIIEIVCYYFANTSLADV